VHCRPVDVIVHITAQVEVLPLIAGLDLTTLLASVWREGGIERQFKPFGQLVLQSDPECPECCQCSTSQ
jgi:hypothetical protein